MIVSLGQRADWHKNLGKMLITSWFHHENYEQAIWKRLVLLMLNNFSTTPNTAKPFSPDLSQHYSASLMMSEEMWTEGSQRVIPYSSFPYSLHINMIWLSDFPRRVLSKIWYENQIWFHEYLNQGGELWYYPDIYAWVNLLNQFLRYWKIGGTASQWWTYCTCTGQK